MASVTFSKVLLWNRNTDTATVLSSKTSNASGQLSITGLIAGNDYAVIPADDVATVVSIRNQAFATTGQHDVSGIRNLERDRIRILERECLRIFGV